MDEHTVVKVSDLVQKFGKLQILRNISLDVREGEIIGLLGPSGSGKTTLVRAIAGIGNITSGRISVFGKRMPSLKAMARIGYMAQADALYTDMTGLENLEFFADLYSMPKHRRRQRIRKVVEWVDLQEAIRRQVHTYSGGMKRRLSLAIALQHQPDLLILDEPTVGLDPVLRQTFWQGFEQLRADGTAILLTTHTMDEANHCDRIALIRDGELIAMGTPDELITRAGAHDMEDAFLYYAGTRGEARA